MALDETDYDGQMLSGDRFGLKFPCICLMGEKKKIRNLLINCNIGYGFKITMNALKGFTFEYNKCISEYVVLRSIPCNKKDG